MRIPAPALLKKPITWGIRELRGLRFVCAHSAWFCRDSASDRGALWLRLARREYIRASIIAHMADYDLGILFVHGIGQQASGETLDSAAGRLLEWLRENQVTVDFESTVLKPTGGDAAFTQVTLHCGSSKPVRVLLAESRWADVFDSPSSLEFSKWLYGSGSAVIGLQTAEWCLGLLCRTRRLLGQPAHAGKATGPALFLSVLTGIGALMVLPIFQLAILLLAALSAIPLFKIAVLAKSTMQTLASILGDSTVYCNGILGREAIRSKVEKDLGWMKPQCGQIVLAAHSQGAAVALDAVKRVEAKPNLLITYGSGWRKLTALSSIENTELARYCRFVLPVATAVITPWFLMGPPARTASVFLGASFIIVYGLTAFQRALRLELDIAGQISEFLSRGVPWVDMPAAFDPVPAGALLHWSVESRREGRKIIWTQISKEQPKRDSDSDSPAELEKVQVANFETVPVVNFDNPIADHTSYWQSADFIEQFVGVINCKTNSSIGPKPDPAARHRVYRHLRCLLKNSCDIALYGMAAGLYWRADQEVRQVLPIVTPFVGEWAKSLIKGSEQYAPNFAWLLGALAMIGATMIWTRLVSGPVWKQWDRNQARDGAGKLREFALGSAYLVFCWVPIYVLYAGLMSARIGTSAELLTALAEKALTNTFQIVLWLIAAAAVVAMLAAGWDWVAAITRKKAGR